MKPCREPRSSVLGGQVAIMSGAESLADMAQPDTIVSLPGPHVLGLSLALLHVDETWRL